MKSSFLTFLLSILFSVYALSQDCKAWFPTRIGAKMEYQHIDNKSKLKSTDKMTIVKYETVGSVVSVTVNYESVDPKGKTLDSSQLVNSCENGVFKFDLKSISVGQMTQAGDGMNISLTGDPLELPATLVVGQKLKDAVFEIKVEAGGMAVMTIKTTIKDRKVEAIEKLITPAGVFNCYKITYTIVTESVMKMEQKGTTWYSDGIGIVKTEEYDKTGKPNGYMVLSFLKL